MHRIPITIPVSLVGAFEATMNGGDYLIEVEAAFGMKFRCEPHLGVNDTVGCKIGGTFIRNPLERFRCLHDSDRVGEGFQVELEVKSISATLNPRGELIRDAGGETVVAELVGKLDNRQRPQTTVEMIVEEHLWRPAN